MRKEAKMNENQKAAYIQAMAIEAMIRAMGMQAENDQRKHLGQSMAYTEDNFLKLIEDAGIHHNGVMRMFRD